MGIDAARSDDSASLKSAVLGYINLDTSIALHPPIDITSPHKSLRGWNHPITATLLTPIKFEANEMFIS